MSRRGALYFVRLVRVGMARGGKVARLFAGVGQIAGGVEPGKVARRRGGGFLGLALVELLYIFLHGGLVCRREISGDNVARRPCPGGRAVLRSRDGEHVPVLFGHKHRFRRGAVRSNREQVRSLRQY